MTTATQPRLKARYNNTIKQQLAKDLGINNDMQIPKLEKIVINMGVGLATDQGAQGTGKIARCGPGQRPAARRGLAGTPWPGEQLRSTRIGGHGGLRAESLGGEARP